MKKKVIVIGTNHAGTYAVRTMAKNYGDKLDISTFDSNDNISFLGCGMALWVGNQIDKPDGLFYATPELLKSEGIKTFMEHEVVDVDFDNKKVLVKNKDGEFSEEYDNLVISVGSWPIKPPIEGIDLENIIYAKLYQHAIEAKKIIADPSIKRIGVVGGGYIGIELVEAFKRSGKEAILITDQNILNRYYDKEFTDVMTTNLKDNGVVVADYQKVQKFEGEDGKVKKIVTDKDSYDVDVVLMSVGFGANTKFLDDKKLDMDSRGVIIVNDHQETNIKDVYAIGDCALNKNNVTNQNQHIALATNAVRNGIIAAHNVGGTKLKMNGVQGSNAIHIYGLTMTSTGLSDDSAKQLGYDTDSATVTDTIRADFMPDNEEVSIKVVWDKKTLKILGAQIMSKEDITLAIHMFSLAIEVGYTIDKLATLDLFFLPHFNKPENFITKVGLVALEKILKY